ncbi:hypothetical protein [Verrucomicrobium sp. BvORR034]|uniref:hypothetical protein n=1 Tax=Verrucomicrobium sp. BvORR034 TaxID=1396418 RepID=UPI000678E01F|nr:hypothetical protein [Verrucomicrobium sp. BvORR034]
MAKKSEHAAPDARRQSRAVWSVALSLLALAMIGPVLFLAIYDGPAPEDGILTPDWTTLLKGTDPSPLATLIDAVSLPRDPSYEPSRMLMPLTSAQQQFLEDHSSVFIAVGALLNTDPAIWIWPDAGLPQDFTMYLGSPLQFSVLERFLERRIEFHLNANRPDLAIADCLKMAQLGSHLSRVKGNLWRIKQTLELQSHAELALEALLTQAGVSESQIQACLTALLALHGPDRETLRFDIQVQHQLFKQLISNRSDQDTFFRSNYPGSRPEFASEIKPNFCLSTWFTRVLPIYEGLAVDWKTGLAAAQKNYIGQPTWVESVRQTLTLNRLGANLTQQAIGQLCSTLQDVMDHATLHDVVIQMLALRLYELRHGHLPARLEELTPGILPALPPDTYSGVSYHWNPTTQALYSAGPDGTDNHGDIDHVSPTPTSRGGIRLLCKDLGQYYWWSEAARKSRDDH